MPEQSIYSETGIIHQFTAQRTGREGAVREYLSGADLTLANFENPVIRDAVYHPDATTFTGDLRLMVLIRPAWTALPWATTTFWMQGLRG